MWMEYEIFKWCPKKLFTEWWFSGIFDACTAESRYAKIGWNEILVVKLKYMYTIRTKWW